MKPVVFDDEARAEFDAAAAYYEAQRVGLGGDFVTEIEQAVKRISLIPQAFAPYANGARKCILRRFPTRFIFWRWTTSSGLPQWPINAAAPAIGLIASLIENAGVWWRPGRCGRNEILSRNQVIEARRRCGVRNCARVSDGTIRWPC